MMATTLEARPVASPMAEKTVLLVSSGVFDLPMMRRLIDHRLICVRIPARIEGILNTVVRKPVTAPQTAPASMAPTMASAGSTPATTSTAQTAPPVAKLPSTVMAAMSSSLKVMNTPSTMTPQRMPWETAPSIAVSMLFLSIQTRPGGCSVGARKSNAYQCNGCDARRRWR